ncbi:hypothetical protein SAMN04515617_12817 [Collimonas sp. OK242]|uniref:immunity protein Tsi6 family protein n=1 Tax=Collimonas sp. OK242 TaxID=1798195 RepID=UPI00089A5C98|nr:immunity protein Tsi6 family protein [Collimonas sp. OK242]SDY89756.1 hypothetical protein SAMN04515617_12817 [Collimonas sp. OK242]
MSERLKLLESGKKRCDELLSKYPGSVALQSVAKQIEYLIELEQGIHSDRSRLKDITIGVLTAREIEQLDDDAAEIFYQIASASKVM